ncbi:MAG: hydroxymethylglutaryl-CoA synthase [Myxococcota bacterium]
MSASELGIGIEDLNVYLGCLKVPVRSFFQARGLDERRYGNLQMQDRSIALPHEDPVTHAVNAAKPIVDALGDAERASIEVLVTASESGVDMSKSIASYVHRYLGLSGRCRLLEVKQACFATTGAVQLASGYLASGISPGARALVIGTDVAIVNERAQYAEPTIGTGAAALLLGPRPRVFHPDHGAFGNHSFETMDSARPRPDFEIADVDGSLFAYLDCLDRSFAAYADRVEGVDFERTFDYLAFHTPFVGLVKAAHRKMMRSTGADPGQVAADYERRVAPSLVYPGQVGNLCSASVYLALASIIDSGNFDEGTRVGLFSYGSGCSSEFFSGRIDMESKRTLAKHRIAQRLADRIEITFEQYERLLEENMKCLVPVADRVLETAPYDALLDRIPDRDPMLVLKRIRHFHREYDWV